MSCRFVASDQPRMLRGRHEDDCPGDCDGCQPCSEAHCGTCEHRHVEELTCPECVGEARDNLTEIVARVAHLPTEAEHRGVDSEAAMLAGPAADAEQWRQRRRYGLTDHPDDRLGDLDPYRVLGVWDLLLTEHLGTRRTVKVSVEGSAAFIGRNLSDLAQDGDFPFDALAKELRKCCTHLEAVLHDQSQGDRANVGCFECGGDLERRLSDDGFEDRWTCRKCRRRYTDPEYHFALRASLEAATSEAAT